MAPSWTTSRSASPRAPSTWSTRPPRRRPPRSPSAVTSPVSRPTRSGSRAEPPPGSYARVRLSSARVGLTSVRAQAPPAQPVPGGGLGGGRRGPLRLDVAFFCRRSGLSLPRPLFSREGTGLGLPRPILGREHAVGEVADHGHGQRGIAPDQMIQAVGRDYHERHRLGRDGGRRAGGVAEEPELAEKLPLLEHVQEPFFPGHQLADLDLPEVHEEGLALGVVPLPEDDLARAEGACGNIPDLAAHG